MCPGAQACVGVCACTCLLHGVVCGLTSTCVLFVNAENRAPCN